MVGELGGGGAAPLLPLLPSLEVGGWSSKEAYHTTKPGADPALFPLLTVYVGNWRSGSINIRVDCVPDLVVDRGRD